MAENTKKDAAAEAPEAGAPDDQAAGAAGKGGKKKLLIILAGALVVVGGGVGAFFMFSGGGAKKEAAQDPNKPVAVYVDVPMFAIQINGDGDQTHFLKLTVTMELAKPEDVEKVKVLLPRVQDDFNAFLLNLRIEDLRGSAGLQRVKDALLLRANQVLSPITLSNVLYKEILVQ